MRKKGEADTEYTNIFQNSILLELSLPIIIHYTLNEAYGTKNKSQIVTISNVKKKKEED